MPVSGAGSKGRIRNGSAQPDLEISRTAAWCLARLRGGLTPGSCGFAVLPKKSERICPPILEIGPPLMVGKNCEMRIAVCGMPLAAWRRPERSAASGASRDTDNWKLTPTTDNCLKTGCFSRAAALFEHDPGPPIKDCLTTSMFPCKSRMKSNCQKGEGGMGKGESETVSRDAPAERGLGIGERGKAKGEGISDLEKGCRLSACRPFPATRSVAATHYEQPTTDYQLPTTSY